MVHWGCHAMNEQKHDRKNGRANEARANQHKLGEQVHARVLENISLMATA